MIAAASCSYEDEGGCWTNNRGYKQRHGLRTASLQRTSRRRPNVIGCAPETAAEILLGGQTLSAEPSIGGAAKLSVKIVLFQRFKISICHAELSY